MKILIRFIYNQQVAYIICYALYKMKIIRSFILIQFIAKMFLKLKRQMTLKKIIVKMFYLK